MPTLTRYSLPSSLAPFFNSPQCTFNAASNNPKNVDFHQKHQPTNASHEAHEVKHNIQMVKFQEWVGWVVCTFVGLSIFFGRLVNEYFYPSPEYEESCASHLLDISSNEFPQKGPCYEECGNISARFRNHEAFDVMSVSFVKLEMRKLHEGLVTLRNA